MRVRRVNRSKKTAARFYNKRNKANRKVKKVKKVPKTRKPKVVKKKEVIVEAELPVPTFANITVVESEPVR